MNEMEKGKLIIALLYGLAALAVLGLGFYLS